MVRAGALVHGTTLVADWLAAGTPGWSVATPQLAAVHDRPTATAMDNIRVRFLPETPISDTVERGPLAGNRGFLDRRRQSNVNEADERIPKLVS